MDNNDSIYDTEDVKKSSNENLNDDEDLDDSLRDNFEVSDTEEQTETKDDTCIYIENDDEDEEDDNYNIDINDSKRVPNDERITMPKLSKYERVRILGVRAKQITMGAKVLIKNPNKSSAIEIAELEHNMIPFIIKRPLPNNKYELWKLSELEK